MTKSVRMTRRVSFSSGRRYWIPSLTDRENLNLFGKWASPFNHGHNYVLDVQVEGLVDTTTGMVVNIKRIDDALRATIVRQFDGKSINDQVPYFHDRSTSLENLAVYVCECLAEPEILPSGVRLTSIRLEEMPTFFVELITDRTPALMLLT